MKKLDVIAAVLLVVGGLNWGLVGLFKFDLVKAIFGGTTVYDPGAVTRVVYVILAVSALYLLTLYDKVTRDD